MSREDKSFREHVLLLGINKQMICSERKHLLERVKKLEMLLETLGIDEGILTDLNRVGMNQLPHLTRNIYDSAKNLRAEYFKLKKLIENKSP